MNYIVICDYQNWQNQPAREIMAQFNRYEPAIFFANEYQKEYGVKTAVLDLEEFALNYERK